MEMTLVTKDHAENPRKGAGAKAGGDKYTAAYYKQEIFGTDGVSLGQGPSSTVTAVDLGDGAARLAFLRLLTVWDRDVYGGLHERLRCFPLRLVRRVV